MFGPEDNLAWSLAALAAGVGLLSALLTWAAARRYGRGPALVVPLLAFLAVGLVLWRTSGYGGHSAMGAIAAALVFAGPAVGGGLLGLILSPFPRR